MTTTPAPTTARKPLTGTTWATLLADHAYLSRDYARSHNLSWTHEHDLAVELGADGAAGAHLPEADRRVLVSFTTSGLPVDLSWSRGRERMRAAAIVEYMSRDQLYVRYCGFGHWIPLRDVTRAASFANELTFADDDE